MNMKKKSPFTEMVHHTINKILHVELIKLMNDSCMVNPTIMVYQV